MCTVSFIARQRGYALAMNRDEKLSRAPGRPPKKISLAGHTVICPSEPGGGTWIALNDAGVAFALINWYAIKRTVLANPVSRGGVVKAVAAETSPIKAFQVLRQLPLNRIRPFRLVGVFAPQQEIYEWRWDLQTLLCGKRPWKSQQWISSGYDEPAAQKARSKTFRRALKQRTAGNIGWLRRLHQSHAAGPGPFSTCMHRPDAATVSYTEIVASKHRATMAYCNAAPCQSRTVPNSLLIYSPGEGTGPTNSVISAKIL